MCLTDVTSLSQRRHHSSDSATSGRDRSYSTDSGEALPSRLKEDAWLQEISASFLQQYVQYLQSIGFILVQVRPPSPARRCVPEGVESMCPVKELLMAPLSVSPPSVSCSIARARAAMLSSMSSEGRMSFSYVKQKSEDSPKVSVGISHAESVTWSQTGPRPLLLSVTQSPNTL